MVHSCTGEYRTYRYNEQLMYSAYSSCTAHWTAKYTKLLYLLERTGTSFLSTIFNFSSFLIFFSFFSSFALLKRLLTFLYILLRLLHFSHLLTFTFYIFDSFHLRTSFLFFYSFILFSFSRFSRVRHCTTCAGCRWTFERDFYWPRTFEHILLSDPAFQHFCARAPGCFCAYCTHFWRCFCITGLLLGTKLGDLSSTHVQIVHLLITHDLILFIYEHWRPDFDHDMPDAC